MRKRARDEEGSGKNAFRLLTSPATCNIACCFLLLFFLESSKNVCIIIALSSSVNCLCVVCGFFFFL